LSVAGEPIYISDYNYENVRYFLNLVGYACERNSGGGGVGGSINLNVPILKQTDPQWANQVYNNYSPTATNQTISKWGCALTSAAMILNYYNHNITPGELDNWLKQNKGYNASHGIKFQFVAAYATQNKNSNANRPGLEYLSQGYSATNLQEEIQGTRPAIVEVVNPASPSNVHFVVARGVSESDFVINDPLYNRTILSEHASYNSIRKFQPTFTDASYLLIYTDPDVNIKISNQDGVEIIGSYYIEKPIGSIDGESVGQPIGVFSLAKPLPGNYVVELSGKNGKYNIESNLISPDGQIVIDSFNGILSDNQTDKIGISIGDDYKNYKVVSIDSILSDLEAVYLQGYVSKHVYMALKAELQIAKLFYTKSRNKLYKMFLHTAFLTIKNSTPTHISEEISNILQEDIKLLING